MAKKLNVNNAQHIITFSHFKMYR